MAIHSRTFDPTPTGPEYQPGPCLACGCKDTRELGQYLGTPALTLIRCPRCGHQVIGTGDTIEAAQDQARARWENPALDAEDERTATGLLEEDP